MKVNLNSISKRALSFIKTPKFLNSELKSKFEVSLDESDKILTVFYWAKLSESELLFSESLAILSKNRKISDLWKINFREVENFLRDENHLEAFLESLPEMTEALEKTKISLIASAYKVQINMGLPKLQIGVSHWGKMNLVAKNQWASDFLSALGWQLIFCNDEVLTVAGSPSGVPDHDLQKLCEQILGEEEIVLPMKVVAVQ